MRLFVAADLPRAVCRRFADHGVELEASGGWRAIPAESIHITLAFLGESPEAAVAPIRDVLEAAWRPVGGLTAGAVLRLPPRRARVAAVTIGDPRGELSALRADLVARLAAARLHTPEGRPFLPHATVARRRGGPEGDVAAADWSLEPFDMAHLTLYSSRLSPRGASYEALARIAVGLGERPTRM